MTPFIAVYGRDPPTITKYTLDHHDPPSLQDLLLQRDLILNQLKNNLLKAQHYMKKYANRKHSQLEFNVGDLVLVKLQPYRQHSVALRKNQKLGLRYFGPFLVLQKNGYVAYKLLVQAFAKIHPVFHVSWLKPCKGEHQQSYVPLPMLIDEFGAIVQPSKILQSRIILRGPNQIPQVLVQWEGLDTTKTTWEDLSLFQGVYPNFNLGDKVDFYGGGNVTSVEEILANKVQGNTVTRVGHVGANDEIMMNRKSERKRVTNYALKDYIWGLK